MRKLALITCICVLAPLTLAACGDDEEDATTTEAATTTEEAGGEGGSVALSADPDGALAYEQDSLSAPAGAVTIEFDNPAALGHDVVVEDADGNELARTEVISESTATASGDFEAGEYTYYCSVGGHRDAGMEGTLSVE